MRGYDTGMVCLNGHEVSSMAGSSPDLREEFCSQCGQKTIMACPECEATIRGYYHVPNFIGVGEEWRAPAHCHNCGQPYPWTRRRAEALTEIVDELDELDDETRHKLKKSVPDIVADTPKSETAGLRFKKAATKVGKASGRLLTKVLMEVATEAVKKSMGLQ